MVSESTEKILAMIVVLLAFLSLPVLLFSIILLAAVDASYIFKSVVSGTLQDWSFVAGISVLLLFLIALFALDVRWIRKPK